MEKKELKERFVDEKTGIEYIRHGDYYYERNKVLGHPQAIFDGVRGSGSYSKLCMKIYRINGKILNFMV